MATLVSPSDLTAAAVLDVTGLREAAVLDVTALCAAAVFHVIYAPFFGSRMKSDAVQ
jgi:hypothetical protein